MGVALLDPCSFTVIIFDPSPMAARKRSLLKRQRDLVLMYRMQLRGHTQQEIAEKFNIHQTQVCKDLKSVRDRVRQRTMDKVEGDRNEKLEELREMKRELWSQWERSKEAREVQSQKKTSLPTGERREASLRTEGQCGNPAFIAEIRRVGQEECKIAGLYAPKKMDLGNKDGKPLEIQFIEIGGQGPSAKDELPLPIPTAPTQENIEMQKKDHVEQPEPEKYVPSDDGLQFEAVCPQEELQNALTDFAAECGKFHRGRKQSKKKAW
jgi:hypothetical protein